MSNHGGYGGGMGGINMQSLMQQARRMQEQMAKAQEELKEEEIEGSSGGGIVKVVVDGFGALKSVNISPAAVDPDDIEMLEDLIIAAYNEAAKEAEQIKSAKLPAGAGGMM